MILSPNCLAKLFSYNIAAESYNTGGEWAWKQLTSYGILHECLIQYMLESERFHLDYPGLIQLLNNKQKIFRCVSICSVALITSKAWFTEESFSLLPESGVTFIIPTLVCADDS